MISQMRNVRNGNVQEPNHNVVSFFVYFQPNVNPIAHKEDCYRKYERNENISEIHMKINFCWVGQKSGINVIYIIVIHIYYSGVLLLVEIFDQAGVY
jgi:hypothetical protein